MTLILENLNYASERLSASLFRILKKNELCAMATVDSNGQSHIHTAYFCYTPALHLFFVSDPMTKHCQNLDHAATMAVAVFDSSQAWSESHCGLQLFGTCKVANKRESLKALAVHAARFHAYREYLKAMNPIERRNQPYKFFIFSPTDVKLCDESEFGEEVFIPAHVRRS